MPDVTREISNSEVVTSPSAPRGGVLAGLSLTHHEYVASFLVASMRTLALLLLAAHNAAARTVQPRSAAKAQASGSSPQLFCSLGGASSQKALLNGAGRRQRQCTSVLSRLRGGADEGDDEKVEGECIGIGARA